MASFIIYCIDQNRIDQTISCLIDKTHESYIDEIIVCNDTGSEYNIKNAKCIVSNRIGRARAWNAAADISKGQELIFLEGITKFGNDWFPPLSAKIEDNNIVSPIVHALDADLWTMENNRWERFGWRWDLNLYNRISSQIKESPAISSYCFAISKDWFYKLGKFDNGMLDGHGEDIELSLRNWLFGGKCIVVDDSTIASSRADAGMNTIKNLTRIVETWMPEYATNFYRSHNIRPNDVNCGRIDNLLNLQIYQKKSIEWFLSSLQPELFGVYKLRDSGVNKSIAIVGPGHSVDLINSSYINKHDIVIGIDYMGMLFDCDYVMTDAAHIIVELRKNYSNEKFILPTILENRTSGRFDNTLDIASGSIQFELEQNQSNLLTVEPPFCNFGNLTLTAIHFALYLNPSYITLFGCDNKIIYGNSHSSKIEYYNNGSLWPDSDATRQKFAYYEFGLNKLSQLAQELEIPLFRIGHA